MRITGPVLDAADAVGLARFYERLLGWTMVECEGPRDGYPPEDGWAKLRSPDGDVKLEFQWEQHYEPPAWPAVPGEQQMMIHLDIEVDDLDERSRLGDRGRGDDSPTTNRRTRSA